MISKTVFKAFGRKKYLAAAIPLIMAAQAQGFEFFMGEMEGSLDSQISMGSSWRMEDQDAGLIKGIDLATASTNAANNNDGDTRFDNGDAFSQIFKGSHDLQVSYQNYGAFVRGKYWYDGALEEAGDQDDEGYHDLAKFSGAEVLDAFVYGEFEILDMPLDVRLGKQVVSWGESTFILGGVNQINPFDVSAFRRPGAEIKEGLIPVNMAFASLGLSESLSAEAFYQLDYKETVTAGCGTFFSTNDYQPDGCDIVNTAAGDVSRHADGNRRPDGDGQFGVAFRYFSESLDTEFGFYAMNVHGRLPLISGTKADIDEIAILSSGALNGDIGILMGQGLDQGTATVSALAGLTTNGLSLTGATVTGADVAASYFVEYPEDQQLAGISFATNVGTIALSGEITHKLDVPLQINSTMLLGATLQADAIYAATFLGAMQLANPQTPAEAAIAQSLANNQAIAGVQNVLGDFGVETLGVAEGSASQGYRSFDVTQAQVTAIKLIDQVLGASRFAIIGEAGYTFVHDFDDSAPGSIIFDGDSAGDDTVTEGSWGYRARIIGQYNDVFSGVNLSPTLSISHDVDGVSPAPGGNFIEGEKVLGLTLNAEYQNIYTAAVSYTQYSGGKTNSLVDRDFASITVGMQF